jgi:hypothetical protein
LGTGDQKWGNNNKMSAKAAGAGNLWMIWARFLRLLKILIYPLL